MSTQRLTSSLASNPRLLGLLFLLVLALSQVGVAAAGGGVAYHGP